MKPTVHHQTEDLNYRKLARKALGERSVNQAAKDWGIPQTTLNNYINGGRLPDYGTALKMARAARIDPGLMLELLADEQLCAIATKRKKGAAVGTDLCGATSLPC